MPTCHTRISVNYATIVGSKSGFLVIDKDSAFTNERFRKGFNEFAVPRLVIIDTPTLEERQHG